jgi:hypothetical protein
MTCVGMLVSTNPARFVPYAAPARDGNRRRPSDRPVEGGGRLCFPAGPGGIQAFRDGEADADACCVTVVHWQRGDYLRVPHSRIVLGAPLSGDRVIGLEPR